MGQVLLESLTSRQLLLFGLLLFCCMTAFFIVGGTKGADPASANVHIANIFNGKEPFASDEYWEFYKLGDKNKDKNDNLIEKNLYKYLQDHSNISAADLVFSSKLPHPGSKMHPAYQFMLVIMNIRVDFMEAGKDNDNDKLQLKWNIDCDFEFNAKMAYSDADEPKDKSDWTLFHRVSNESRPLICTYMGQHDHEGDRGGHYQCQDQHFFELGSIAHKHYLINVNFPGEGLNKHCLAGQKHFLEGIDFVEIHQNGGYTISLFVSKTVMFPFIVAALLFFVRRIRREEREWLLLEKSTLWLGVATTILLFPVDWFTLATDMPYMLFFSDLRQGLFYVSLLTFWCLFAGEHILDQEVRNKLGSYKYEIGCIAVGCISLFIFDTVERGVQMKNPFHTIWKRDSGEKAAKAFIALAGVASIIYCLFFMRLLYYVRKNIKMKSVALPAMQDERRIFYENKIYRYRVLLYATLFNVVMTVCCFILDQVNETTWKFQDNSMNDYVIVSSAMHFGVFGMWGTYVFAILILYSPDGSTDNQLNVMYQRSEHLLNADPNTANDDDDDDDDEDMIQLQHPKKV